MRRYNALPSSRSVRVLWLGLTMPAHVVPYLPCSRGSASTTCPGRTMSPPAGCHATIFGAMVFGTCRGTVSGSGPISMVDVGRWVGMDGGSCVARGSGGCLLLAPAQLPALMAGDDDLPKTVPRAPSHPPTSTQWSWVGLCMCRLLVEGVGADARGAKDGQRKAPVTPPTAVGPTVMCRGARRAFLAMTH